MLDETTCPVCDRNLMDWERRDHRVAESPELQARWAIAHYLAHLVQQQEQPTVGELKIDPAPRLGDPNAPSTPQAPHDE